MNCPNCGTSASPGVRFCARCGAELPGNVPIYASPVATRRWGKLSMFFGIALLAGMGVGWLMFLRERAPEQPVDVTTGVTKEQTATAQPSAVSKPDRSTEETPRSEGGTRAGVSRSRVRPVKDRSELAAPISSQERVPAGAVTNMNTTAEQAPTAVNPPPADQADTKPRRAIQEPDSPPSDSPVRAPAPLPQDRVVSPNAISPPPQNVTPAKPVYSGANAGMATWTGNLGKGDTLTITSGTPSSGVLTGASLPGVPVRIIIDQTNLGFVESPSTANDFKKLVLKSHGRHDKITIHWTVIQ